MNSSGPAGRRKACRCSRFVGRLIDAHRTNCAARSLICKRRLSLLTCRRVAAHEDGLARAPIASNPLEHSNCGSIARQSRHRLPLAHPSF